MKYLVAFSRVVVGVLFIISGLIKLNDPVGFSFKLEEYFGQGVLDLPFLMPLALAIALVLVIVEVLLGIMLLTGFKPKLTVWSLLGMIVFFTFLTWYSAYFNKVTDCGCFGDAVKLTPWESFTKDVILLVLIVILVLGIKHIKPLFSAKVGWVLHGIALIACVAFGYHVLNHLPVKDFRPYKIGANIEQGMVVPEDAPKPIYEYAWKFNTPEGEKVVVTNGDYPTVEGEFVGVETEEIQKGYEPPIHDFTIEQEGQDFTTEFMAEERLVMVIAYDLAKSDLAAFETVKTQTDAAIRNGYKVIGMSASSAELGSAIVGEYDLNFEFYFTDETTLKTIVRSNPAILVVNKGTIAQKEHFNDFGSLKFETPENGIYFDLALKKQLDSILELDQKYRKNPSMDDWGLQMEIDSSNMAFIADIMARYGYPGKSMVGKRAGIAAWYVIQHSNRIPEYLGLMEQAAEAGELPYRLYAMMLDRYLMGQNKPQRYGTQGSSYYIGSPKAIDFIWPIANMDSVNILREQAGFDDDVIANAKRIFGEDFEFKAYTIEEINRLIPETKN
ncbi:BT_3928 family protein [Flagellimonas sp. DF-77]|uniref:BT_3928 family protein n=1 Tax=Flagellimonas algarum TaxID=3230298 RepID=UPI00339A8271